MPVAIRSDRDPFLSASTPTTTTQLLRVPQVRVLATLIPAYHSDPVSEWPTFNRAQLGVRSGYTAISGTVTRVLNGIHEGSSSGDPHFGLLKLGYVEEITLYVEGVAEVNYRATKAGVSAYHIWITHNGTIPQMRDQTTCRNLYQGKGDTHRSKRKS